MPMQGHTEIDNSRSKWSRSEKVKGRSIPKNGFASVGCGSRVMGVAAAAAARVDREIIRNSNLLGKVKY